MINNKSLIYAVKSKKQDVLKNSSSGGMFTVLTDLYLKSGNAVASCIYDYHNDNVVFKIYSDFETRDQARGSKYIQGIIGDGFKDIVTWLNENPNKQVIAFGTGCQMEGLRKYLEFKNLRERVLIVDLICHGVSSPGLWNKYLENNNIRGKLQYISFKDKRNGWHFPTTYIKVNDNEISIKKYSDLFYNSLNLRKSCYKCKFTKIDRNTDITIGDYWGIESVFPDFADPMGVSLVLLHTEKGLKLFDKIQCEVEFIKSNSNNCLQPRLIKPTEEPKRRISFWKDINRKGIDYCLRKYIKSNYINRLNAKIKTKIKSILKKLLAQRKKI